MMGIKKLDAYIIRKFLVTFFMAILFLAVIIVIFDISEKIDDFVQHEVSLKEIVFDYYINFVPFFINRYLYLSLFVTEKT